MATPPAPPVPTTPPTVHHSSHPPAPSSAEVPPAGHGPVPAGATGPAPASPEPAPPGSLAQMLTPIAPARPVPIGSTTTLGQTAVPGSDGAATGGDANSKKSGKDDAASVEGPLSALMRSLASRLGRTGTATTVKRSHDVKETRVSGTSTNTTNANKSDRTAKSENSAQSRSNQDTKSSRDVKVADLSNKTSAQQGKTSSESRKAASLDDRRVDARDAKTLSDDKRADTRDAKTSATKAAKTSSDDKRADTRDAKTSATKAAKTSSDDKRADTRDAKSSAAKDAKTSSAVSDTRAAKNDASSRTGQDGRTSTGAETKASKGSDSRASTAPGASGGFGRGGGKSDREPGAGRAGKDTAVTDAPARPGKGSKPDGTDGPAGVGVPVPKPGGPDQAGAKADKQKEEKKGGADLTKPQAGTGAAGRSAGEPQPVERPRTQSAREAGYRDGNRAAGAVGQAQAYRDGVRDGWSDRQAVDEAERKRMDEAKIRNALTLKPPPKPPMQSAAGSSADLAKNDAGAKAPVVPPKPTTAPAVPARPKPGVDLAKPPKPGGGGPAKAPGTEDTGAPAVPPKPTAAPAVPAQSKPGADPAQPKPSPIPSPMASTTALAQGSPSPGQAAADAVSAAIQPAPHTRPADPAASRRTQYPMAAPTTFAEPATFIEVTPSTVSFIADGERRELGRSEVRTLKGFENQMRDRAAYLRKVAEQSRTAVAVATEHALAAQKLLERTRGVQGGEGLVRVLERLAEQAGSLCAAAEETERRAIRGAEEAGALVINADTRHGPIYQAVVDSPLTSPAEREFYQDQQGG
ncbi:hypothetical protein PUR61_03285 [Streptomyces sp. BE20]|uniref:hypothetical protein n=1 Tax=Streptomyces sp. BE20 TaxID=3002525 RepID=UPI002E76C658|nr:hypothetical protein [Streptomyces sp. BE20]MEE1821226.1 hypothetical protein [Streptomyces sp. BE20]